MKVLKMSILFATLMLMISCGQQKEVKRGYTLVWEENFDDSTKLVDNWSKIPRGGSDWNNYMSDYDGLFEVRSGNLILKGIKNTVLPEDSVPYLTGGVFTKNKKVFGHGRIEINARLFGARSAWPAFWLLPENDPWPHGGEIDIMERLNNDDFVYQTVHSDYTYNQGIKDNPQAGVIAHIHPDKYNVYAVELHADSVCFFINDTHTHTYPRIQTDKSGQFPFGDKNFYLLLDMQLGGSWVGPVNEQDLPTEMHIDWVRYLTIE